MAFADLNIVGKWRFPVFGCLCWDDWDWLTVTVIVNGLYSSQSLAVAKPIGVSKFHCEKRQVVNAALLKGM
jgi:hypothetical protein